jgi:hypothetical protein
MGVSLQIRPSRLPRSKPRFSHYREVAKHRIHSIDFKRQVAQDFIAGETLGPACRRCVRVPRCFVLLKKIGCAGILIKCPSLKSQRFSRPHPPLFSGIILTSRFPQVAKNILRQT